MSDKTVNVPNISCGHCVNTIEREIGSLDGVEGVQAEAATRRVTITWDPELTDWVVIEDAMKDINYPPAPE